MNATQEVREQYKQAVREYIRHVNDEDSSFQAGKMLGVKYALMSLGVNDDELNAMYFACEEEVADEREQEELDAIEHPASQAKVTGDEQ